jgi:hypothetical protein
MIDNFYMFSDLNRDSTLFPLETVYENWSGSSTKIISMTDDEDAYLFSMQLMLGPITIVPFQKFHDDYWCGGNYKKQDLRSYLRGFIFCSNPSLLDYMMSYQGDLMWDKKRKEKAHWSQIEHQGRLGGPFMI